MGGSVLTNWQGEFMFAPQSVKLSNPYAKSRVDPGYTPSRLTIRHEWRKTIRRTPRTLSTRKPVVTVFAVSHRGGKSVRDWPAMPALSAVLAELKSSRSVKSL